MTGISSVLQQVGVTVLERGWLSSNSAVFPDPEGAVVVDTGYATHAPQTVALVERALHGSPLARIINTHLHADHCGGNSALQVRYGCEIHVPQSSYEAVRTWDMSRLSFEATGQRCERFSVSSSLRPGSTVVLGRYAWEVHACGGHDADAVLLFEPQQRVLLAGDALWETRVAIVFEALAEPRGFDAALKALDLIERLAPVAVIPGHGRPFMDASSAVARTRARIEGFRMGQSDHAAAARRALLMFHMLEHQSRTLDQLEHWSAAASLLGGERSWVAQCLQELMSKGLLRRRGDSITLSAVDFY